MEGSPRRNTQANRQTRRQSPYARPAPPPPQPTPSRLRSVLSFLSPFRPTPKPKEPSPEPQEDEQYEEDAEVKEEDDGSAEEAAQFALHGKLLPRDRADLFDAPASPTPATQNQNAAPFRTLGASGFASSFSMPDLAVVASTSTLSTPRLPGNFARSPSHVSLAGSRGGSIYGGSERGGSGKAAEELARFWAEKAGRGEDGLTAVEQAGVMHLMQQAQAESPIPTAFTPNFRAPSPQYLSNPPLPYASSSASVNSSIFGAPTQNGSPAGTYKKRRPLYVGAGQSSRRRKSLAAGLAKSQSESSLFSISSAEPSVAEGKRRRTEHDEEDDIPVASLDDVVAVPSATPAPSPAPVPVTSVSGPHKAQEKPKPSLARFTGTSTPAKPSPLWQVSQAQTPSPSPPRKPTSKTATSAANLMLDVIQQVDAANPLPKAAAAAGKDAILNPYDSGENPLALAGKRAPRSAGAGRAKSATPRRTARTANKAAEVEKPQEKEISPLEQLERTMPAEYRREASAKRTKPSVESPPPAPALAPKKQAGKPAAPAKKEKKVVEAVELSSDYEEEDQLEEDEEMVPAAAVPTKKPVEEKKSASPFSFATSAPPAAKDKPASGFAFGAPASSPFSFGATAPAVANPFAPAPTSAAGAAAPPANTLFSFGTPTSSHANSAPAPSSLTPPPAATAISPRASLPPTPPPVSAPSAFSISPSVAPTPSAAAEPTTPEEAKERAATLDKAKLPLARFSFAGVLSPARRQDEPVDPTTKAIQDLVRNMGHGELPVFAF
ncbi:hypothetical protein JCM1841_006887 [Sporobolomyces salmonicolor]